MELKVCRVGIQARYLNPSRCRVGRKQRGLKAAPVRWMTEEGDKAKGLEGGDSSKVSQSFQMYRVVQKSWCQVVKKFLPNHSQPMLAMPGRCLAKQSLFSEHTVQLGVRTGDSIPHL